ncbi:MAG TPA: 4Fe-4S dicluster domain-containing protein [Acidimicrobiales bacterium]|nr:4Fe-4S dicluster domain-containing protein [Acidimicrobiales bacterium]
MSTGAVIGLAGLDELVKAVLARGFRVVGPTVRDGAVVLGPITGVADMPMGWQDAQGPGWYHAAHTGESGLFNWAVGPQSPKAEFFPPRLTLWRAKPPEYQVEEVADEAAPVALIGLRPCDMAALDVLGGVLDGPSASDPTYQARRRAAFLVVVECARPASTCFCVSMGTGPGIGRGFDLALTELIGRPGGGDGAVAEGAAGNGAEAGPGEPRYLARAGSELGREVLAELHGRPPRAQDMAERVSLLARAASRMGRGVDTSGLAELLARNLGSPRWDEVAARCLACGNCTAVCPTCFCANFEDSTDLEGTVSRRRTWASCSDLAHSYVHGGAVRASIKSRYRQWATHKFSWWWDQFGTSGCVGCGRCITWCPAGIDITEELAALRASDGALVPTTGEGQWEKSAIPN